MKPNNQYHQVYIMNSLQYKVYVNQVSLPRHLNRTLNVIHACENEWGYSWNNSSRNFEVVWEIHLMKCDFTAEIQPWKTDSGTEPVSVSMVWLKNKDKLYWSHLLCSRKIVLHDIMGSPVEHIHGSRASWEINKLSRASWEINKLSHYGTRSNLVSWEVPQDSVLCPELLVLYISDLAATTAYIQTKTVWRWHQLSMPHLHSWRSSNTPQWSKQFLYG